MGRVLHDFDCKKNNMTISSTCDGNNDYNFLPEDLVIVSNSLSNPSKGKVYRQKTHNSVYEGDIRYYIYELYKGELYFDDYPIYRLRLVARKIT